MFNTKERKSAIARMNQRNDELKKMGDKIVKESNDLFSKREVLKSKIDHAWEMLNSFRNTPGELDVQLEGIKIEYTRYASLVNEIKTNSVHTDIKAGAATGSGIATGIGVASLGPGLAMGIATTFGTASTGAAISGLSGAAASNAALAWLGGGALAAGGGGMTAGSSLLALSGPLGWTIAGVSLTVGGMLKSGHNKRLIKQANDATQKINDQILILTGTLTEIKQIENRTVEAVQNIRNFSLEFIDYDRDYKNLNENQQYQLGGAINDTLAYAELLNKNVGKKN